MMKLQLYQVDAFASKLFTGNPAGVCLLDQWISPDLMQAIAQENNLAETAFLVSNGNQFEIRWFTPQVEVDLCGHATLASAHVLMHHGGWPEPTITFLSERSGTLSVQRRDELYVLDFPADDFSAVDPPRDLLEGLSHAPIECFRGKTDYMFVFESQHQIQTMQPRFELIGRVDARGLIVTSVGSGEFDFVSRFFAPQSGVDEDPVTGSAHTTLIPYWSQRLGKTEMMAKQCSARGGVIHCRHLQDRVRIGGEAITYLQGEISIRID